MAMFLLNQILIRDWIFNAWKPKEFLVARCGVSWRMDVRLNTRDEHFVRSNICVLRVPLSALLSAAITIPLNYWQR